MLVLSPLTAFVLREDVCGELDRVILFVLGLDRCCDWDESTS
jgi:hypothetical protein